MSIQNRYDFVLLFDVKDGNPNGDPDAGNLPRIDPETGCGITTDVCLKRKIRNYVGFVHGYQRPFDIYVKEKAVLGRAHFQAFKELNIQLGEEAKATVPDELADSIAALDLPDGMSADVDDDGNTVLVVAPVTDKKEAQKWLKEADVQKEVKAFFTKVLKDVKARKPKAEESEQGRVKMCQTFYDIRTFGAVLSLKTAPNCGQVRGPVQLTFARSVDPVVALEHSITRMAVATEAEAEKQGGDNRTMGRKFTVPYGIYVAHGFVSAHLANQTGFSEEDLELLWQALENMFEHDRSAARGEMATRGLYVFKHDSQLGNAHAHSLFSRIQPRLKDGVAVPRDFGGYDINVEGGSLNPGESREAVPGVSMMRRC